MPSSLPNLSRDVWPVFDILVEVAYVTANFLPGLDAEGYERHEAEGEPLPALVDVAAEVAAVLALDCHLFETLETGVEGVSAAGEDEEHVAFLRVRDAM
jgi:hypothetical protein